MVRDGTKRSVHSARGEDKAKKIVVLNARVPGMFHARCIGPRRAKTT
jgi:hypothetical protein